MPPVTDPSVELRVEVGLAAGPRTPAAEIAWTDLSDRVVSFEMSRGRQGVAQAMPASSVTIEFDCEDGLLDPSRPGGLVDFGVGSGLPGCPVRVRSRVGGAGAWRPVFAGFLAEDSWRVLRDTEWGDTSTVTAVCKTGLVASWESAESVWAAWAAYSRPDLWLRGAGGDSLPNDGSLLLDSSGRGREIRVFAPAGSIGALGTGGLMPGSSDGAIALAPSVGAQTTATFDFTAVTMACLWRSSGTGAQEIMGVRTEGGVWRLRVSLRPEGHMAAQVLSTTGAVLGEANVAPATGQTWNNNRAHVIVARYDGVGRRLDLWVDGRAATATGISGSGAGQVSGRLRLGGGTSTDVVDEWTVFDRVMSSLDVAVLQNIFLQAGWPWSADSIRERFNRWLSLARLPREAVDNFEIQVGPGDGPLDVLRSVKGTVGAELARIAESGLGELWTTRAGRLRLRTRRALDAVDHRFHYRVPVAHLTDEPDPPGGLLPVRRTHPVFSGGRIESVITASRFRLWNLFTREIRNDDAIERFGVRLREWESLAVDDQEPARLARLDVQDHATPRVEMEAVTVDPQTDPAAVEFVTNVELEQTVWFTWTDRAGLPWLVETAVQGVRWRWSQSRWLVDLLLAPHPGTPAPSPLVAVQRRVGPVYAWPLDERLDAPANPVAMRPVAGDAVGSRTAGSGSAYPAAPFVTPPGFRGRGQYLPVAEFPGIDLTGVGEEITIEMLVGDARASQPIAILGYLPAGGQPILAGILDGNLMVQAGGRQAVTPWPFVPGPGQVVEVHHVTAVVSRALGEPDISIWIDGEPQPATLLGETLGSESWGAADLTVGAIQSVPTAPPPQYLGAVAIYPRALTSEERTDLYDAAMHGVLP